MEFDIDKWILDPLWILVHPSYWMQNESYNAEWDKELNELMDAGSDVDVTDSFGYTIMLNKRIIWIANHPYASARPMEKFRTLRIRPARTTIRRLEKYLEERGVTMDDQV